MTDVTFIWLLTGVDSQMTLEFKGVGTGVGTMRALIWSLPCVTSYMSFQFGKFYTGIVAFVTFVWFFVCMAISNVPNKLTCNTKLHVQKKKIVVMIK